jgi:ribosomal protein S12
MATLNQLVKKGVKKKRKLNKTPALDKCPQKKEFVLNCGKNPKTKFSVKKNSKTIE